MSTSLTAVFGPEPEREPFSPTLYRAIQTLIGHFDQRFFCVADNPEPLPDVVITMSRKAHSGGHFRPNVYVGRHGRDVPPHEINLNPDHLYGASDEDAASTILHELVHLWRYVYGPERSRMRHDKIWAAKMESLGLMPSSTGKPGGSTTGSKMSHYILEGGPFAQAFAELQATGWTLDLESGPRHGSARAPELQG